VGEWGSRVWAASGGVTAVVGGAWKTLSSRQMDGVAPEASDGMWRVRAHNYSCELERAERAAVSHAWACVTAQRRWRLCAVKGGLE
jgi:hypothetical protein